MDKQKKIVLQIVIPVAIVVISLLFYFLFTYMFSEKKNDSPSGEITTDIPDVSQKIENNKLKAYDNQRLYERQESISDFEMNFMLDTTSPKSESKEPDNKKVVKTKTPKSKTRLKKEIKKAEKEYQDFITGEQSETMPPGKKTGYDSVIIDQSIMFNSQTASSNKSTSNPKDVFAYINNEQVVINHSLVKLRNAEAFKLKGNINIPANTVFYGNCIFNNGRVLIYVRNIPLNNRLIPCNITVADMDGGEGIYVPYNVETEAGKKSASTTTKRIGSSLGSALKSVTGTNIAGELTGMAAEGIIKGISDGASDKIKLQKVILPNNYKLILKIK